MFNNNINSCYILSIKLKRLSFFIGIILLATSVIFAQEQQPKVIDSLEILGNQKLTDKEILSHIKTRPSQYLNKKQLKADLDSLLSLKKFDKANTRFYTEKGMNGGVAVVFEVRELSIIEEIKYKGLKFVKKEEIIKELGRQGLALKKGNVYDNTKLKNLKSFTLKYLEERGFDKAKITINIKNQSSTSVKIIVAIDEQGE